MSSVVALHTSDPVTTFLGDLDELGPVAWAAIALSSRERESRLWEWDAAYQAALDGGGSWAAEVAANAAVKSGTGMRAAAMVAGAAAALSARHSLPEDTFRLLFEPVAEIVGGPTSRTPVYTSLMSSSTRHLPA